MFIDNSGDAYEVIAEGSSGSTTVTNQLLLEPDKYRVRIDNKMKVWCAFATRSATSVTNAHDQL